MSEGVSVIVCCYNSASRLGETLRHLAAQHTQDFRAEIIVVDNASTDNTGEVAQKLWASFGRKDIPLMVVHEPRPGLSFARAKGVKHSAFTILVFCDDDNWLEAGYLQNTYAMMTDRPYIGALGGVGSAVADVVLPEWFEQYKGSFACYPQNKNSGELTRSSAFLYGAGLAVRKEVLITLAQRGFSPILSDRIEKKLSSGGDVELCYAIRLAGYKLWYSSDLAFRHYLPANRLTEQYLCRLMAASSYSSSQLIVYQYALKGQRVNTWVWVKDSIYQIAFLLRTLVRDGLRSSSRLERKLNLLFAWNRMRGIVAMCNLYQRQYKQITRLKGKPPVD